MSNPIDDANKNTPRTDARIEYDDTNIDDVIDFARQLERELNAANDKIKRLEEAWDAVASALNRSWNGTKPCSDTEANGAIVQWAKAKEAKP